MNLDLRQVSEAINFKFILFNAITTTCRHNIMLELVVMTAKYFA